MLVDGVEWAVLEAGVEAAVEVAAGAAGAVLLLGAATAAAGLEEDDEEDPLMESSSKILPMLRMVSSFLNWGWIPFSLAINARALRVATTLVLFLRAASLKSGASKS